ncbi:flavodoxin family protein [Catalinimonas niigatensis]|uniref:flavodoxin family protein n=1 Tax=Catalinimonas niigatensis TaxID=1397264 RepID=UPI002666E3C0|nr:NAD(P)H-dependent oxidoreductase [Catalinimonas niigatensis]WPP49575.1 NAD(P)H-dependent oxidoreductase [Catalinimonas niigatensis]
MRKVKLAIIYYSSTGANYTMSKWAEAAAESSGVEVKRLIVKETAPQAAIEGNEGWKKFRETIAKQETEATLDDLEWADILIFSVPTRYGNLPSQVQSFFDTTGGLWFQGKLANKVVSGLSSAMNPHGGQETTLQALYKTMIHWGCVIVPAGYTADEIFAAGGNPAGASATVDMEGNIKDEDKIKAAVEHQVKRTIDIGSRLVSQ